jgi:hypothetical protein|tara:strand:+ start:404 stop:631 length:228 start_codon:yes stop_codon:yes gene_type:complete
MVYIERNEMIVRRRNNLTGVWNEMNLSITQEQLDRYDRQEDLVQNIFPELPPPQREFLITGITPNEWDELFGERE